jgi:hypothetical protein
MIRIKYERLETLIINVFHNIQITVKVGNLGHTNFFLGFSFLTFFKITFKKYH